VLPAFGNSEDLRDIEERLVERPDDVSLLFSRATMLDMLKRNDEARDAYIAVIKRDARTGVRSAISARSLTPAIAGPRA
jgi:thioredoxin-like negative regulator of GroEL